MARTLEELQKENDEFRKENDLLRGICAYENIDCLHCGLPREEMARCSSGFPGCARADDMMCAPASIQEKYAPKEQGQLGEATPPESA